MKVSIKKCIYLLNSSYQKIEVKPGEYTMSKIKNPFINRGSDWYTIATDNKNTFLGESVSSWNEWERKGLIYIFYEEEDVPT